MGWWYHAKKQFQIFPGITRARSGDWLREFYDWRSKEQGPLRIALNAFIWLSWQIWLPIRSRKIATKYGLDDNWRKMAQEIGTKCFADPNDVALFRVESEVQMAQFMRRFEHMGISRLINPKCWMADCILGNKLAFHNLCVDNGFPQPAIYAAGRGQELDIASIPEKGSFIVKPVGGEGGRGVRVEQFEGDSSTFPEFAKFHICSRSDAWLIQRKLEPHPDLKPLSGTALLGIRVVTVLNERSEAEAVHALLRFPRVEDALVDNLKAGGMMAPIDMETGRLGLGCIGNGVGEMERHPVSGQQIKGMLVPHFDDGLALALKAHNEAFSQYTVIGWDIAIAEDGVYLLEGNGKPSSIASQRGIRSAAGDNRYGELIAFHISKAIAQLN